jgi:hypothetical protein
VFEGLAMPTAPMGGGKRNRPPTRTASGRGTSSSSSLSSARRRSIIRASIHPAGTATVAAGAEPDLPPMHYPRALLLVLRKGFLAGWLSAIPMA